MMSLGQTAIPLNYTIFNNYSACFYASWAWVTLEKWGRKVAGSDEI